MDRNKPIPTVRDKIDVAPLAGAWIETLKPIKTSSIGYSHIFVGIGGVFWYNVKCG